MKPSLILMLIFLSTQSFSFAVSQDDGEGDYGKNIVSVVPMMVNNHGVGFGIYYERVLTRDYKLSFYMPVGMSFNNGESFGYAERKRTVSTYAGLKYYPTSSAGSLRYAIGGAFGFNNILYDGLLNISPGGATLTDGYSHFSMFGILVDNYLEATVYKKLSVGMNLGIGMAGNTELDYDGSQPYVLLMFKIGYRF